MRFGTRQEIEYLGAVDQNVSADPTFLDEMSRQLDALRRYDQFFCEADWCPDRGRNMGRTEYKKSML
jgi:hypothetical protein